MSRLSIAIFLGLIGASAIAKLTDGTETQSPSPSLDATPGYSFLTPELKAACQSKGIHGEVDCNKWLNSSREEPNREAYKELHDYCKEKGYTDMQKCFEEQFSAVSSPAMKKSVEYLKVRNSTAFLKLIQHGYKPDQILSMYRNSLKVGEKALTDQKVDSTTAETAVEEFSAIHSKMSSQSAGIPDSIDVTQ